MSRSAHWNAKAGSVALVALKSRGKSEPEGNTAKQAERAKLREKGSVRGPRAG